MRIIFYTVFAMLFLSCATTKKTSVAADINTSATITTDKITTHSISTLIDTTKSGDSEITYTKIEFYARAPDTVLYKNAPKDTVMYMYYLPNLKSVETFTIKKSNEQKGITQTQSATTDSIKQNAVFINSLKVDETTEQKVKYWLKYIMWIAICATIITAIIYTYKFFNKIKKS
jgi:hypothetical protein